MNMIVTPKVLTRIEEHGEQHYPEEGAGLLLGVVKGSDRVISDLIPLANTFDESQRARRYLLAPEAMLQAEQQADSLGLDILGVFHSHPDHPAQPSKFDRDWAWPWFIYLITSVQKGQVAAHRAWQLTEDRSDFKEISLQLERFQEVS